jgi:hypothetical protein
MSKLQYAGEYIIDVCKIASTGGEIIDITPMITTINIFEDIFKSALTGDISVVDTNNLLTGLPLIGQEKLILKLSTPQSTTTTRNRSLDFTEHPLYIYKVDSSIQINPGTTAFTLSFTTAEAVRSNRIRVSQAFDGEPAVDIVQKIIRDEDLLNSKKEFYYEETANNYKFVSPNMRPFDFINSIAKRCLSSKYNFAPTFLFFETCKGFYFRTVDSMMDRKNVKAVFIEEQGNLGDTDSLRHMMAMISYDVVGATNVMMNMRKGMYASNLLMIDLVNKTVENFNYNYFDSFEEGEKQDIHVDAHKDYASDSKPLASECKDDFGNMLVDYDQSTMYMQAVDRNQPGGLLSVRHTGQYDYTGTDSWLQRRKGRFSAMDAGLTLNIVVHGQTSYAAGDMIGINLKNKTPRSSDSVGDPYYSGRYLITKLRHKFTRGDGSQSRHTCHMQVVRDTVREAYPANGVSFKDAENVTVLDQLIPTGLEDPNPTTY